MDQEQDVCTCIDCKLSEFPCNGDCGENFCLGCEEKEFEAKEQEYEYHKASGLLNMVGKKISEL